MLGYLMKRWNATKTQTTVEVGLFNKQLIPKRSDYTLWV